jgi:phosphatidylglycerophosphate synthase
MTTAPPDRVVALDLRGVHRPRPGAGPLVVVCGLPVLLRDLLVIQRQGVHRAVLLVHPEDRAAVSAALATWSRLHLEILLREDAGASLAPLADVELGDLLYWPGTVSFGRFAPDLVTLEGLGEALAITDGESGLALIAGAALREHAALDAAALLARLEEQGRVVRRPLDRPSLRLLDPADTIEAERALLRSLRKEVDGAVAKFDRYISLSISRHLMRLSLAPNVVTVVGGLLGVTCGLVASLGGYGWMLVAAIGFQLNSILDGIDGEIARAKLCESRLGQWMDTLADDSSNLCYAAGVSVGCYRTWGSPCYLVLGAAAAVGFMITAALMYRYLLTVAHSGDLNDFRMPWELGAPERTRLGAGEISGLSRLFARVKFLMRRDTFCFLSTLFALGGQLRVMAWLFAAGANAVWITIIGYRLFAPAGGTSRTP